MWWPFKKKTQYVKKDWVLAGYATRKYRDSCDVYAVLKAYVSPLDLFERMVEPVWLDYSHKHKKNEPVDAGVAKWVSGFGWPTHLLDKGSETAEFCDLMFSQGFTVREDGQWAIYHSSPHYRRCMGRNPPGHVEQSVDAAHEGVGENVITVDFKGRVK